MTDDTTASQPTPERSSQDTGPASERSARAAHRSTPPPRPAIHCRHRPSPPPRRSRPPRSPRESEPLVPPGPSHRLRWDGPEDGRRRRPRHRAHLRPGRSPPPPPSRPERPSGPRATGGAAAASRVASPAAGNRPLPVRHGSGNTARRAHPPRGQDPSGTSGSSLLGQVAPDLLAELNQVNPRLATQLEQMLRSGRLDPNDLTQLQQLDPSQLGGLTLRGGAGRSTPGRPAGPAEPAGVRDRDQPARPPETRLADRAGKARLR